MNSLRAIIGPTGGLGYHFTAWRFSKTWNTFRERIRIWLSQWSPQEKQLILFGPSSGYTLSQDFLARFAVIRVVEPDPAARLLFKRKFQSLRDRIRFEAAYDILPWWNEDADDPSEKLKKFLADCETQDGPCAILFSNILGQIPLLKTCYDEPHLQKSFTDALSTKSWASYHDLFSGRSIDMDRCPDAIVMSGDIEVLARRFFRNSAAITDHGTTWLGDGTTVAVTRWNLTPKNSHVIAFYCARRAQ
ncbi:MAG TPA: hypothetical protein VM432_14240 [Bdellovibrionales bacterium]|nr:hypothetical protein [Bdellovibrionales bacterium]